MFTMNKPFLNTSIFPRCTESICTEKTQARSSVWRAFTRVYDVPFWYLPTFRSACTRLSAPAPLRRTINEDDDAQYILAHAPSTQTRWRAFLVWRFALQLWGLMGALGFSRLPVPLSSVGKRLRQLRYGISDWAIQHGHNVSETDVTMITARASIGASESFFQSPLRHTWTF